MCVATPLWAKCEDETHTPKSGDLESSGTPKTQSSVAGAKTPRIEVLFISMERSWSVDVQNGLAWAIWISAAKLWAKERSGVKLAVWLLTTKSCESTSSWRFRRSKIWHWKALEESYNFGLDLIPIGGQSQEMWVSKVLGVQPGTVSRLLLGSPGKKCYLDVAPAGSCREYYVGEDGGFPRVRAMVSQVNPRSPVVCPNTKWMQNEF